MPESEEQDEEAQTVSQMIVQESGYKEPQPLKEEFMDNQYWMKDLNLGASLDDLMKEFD